MEEGYMLEILQDNERICSELNNLINSLFYLQVFRSKLISNKHLVLHVNVYSIRTIIL